MKLATLCYVRTDHQTLMLHRIKKPNDMHWGKWNGLGGKLLAGETPEQCVIREVAEESGLALIKPRLCGVLTFPAFDNLDDWYAFVFVARQFSGELIDSPEGVLRWIDNDQLLGLPLWDGDHIFLKWLELSTFFSAQFIYRGGRLVDHSVVFYPPINDEAPTPLPLQGQFVPRYAPEDDTFCWSCGGPVTKRQCKIICQVCGFMRDCSDP